MRPLSHADDAEIERLASLIIETNPDRVVDVVVAELERALSRQHFLATNFVTGMAECTAINYSHSSPVRLDRLPKSATRQHETFPS